MSKFGWSYPPGAANDPNAPYNQVDFVVEDAIATKDLICPVCQETAEWFREIEKAGFPNDLTHDEVTSEGWHCENCDWMQESFEDDYKRLAKFTESFQPRIDAINRDIANCKRKPAITVDDLFSHCPDGDFEWIDEGMDDSHVYCCGESDCHQQWHESTPYCNMGRKDGYRWVEIGTDDFGDRQPSCEWREEDDYWFNDVGEDLANQSDDYFKGWAEYWLDCAYTGCDPLGECTRPIERNHTAAWLEFCINAAEDMSKYLRN
jgi:hypothetical protein